MKKFYITLGLVAGLAMTSCSDFLDKEPSTALPVDEAITSVEDLQYALNGVTYYLTVNQMSYPSEFGIYADLLSDEFKVIDDYGHSSLISNYTLTKFDDLATNPFQYFYKAIANANKALETSAELNDARVKNLQGQLYAWRALLHFDLARLYAHIPSTVANTSAPDSGIPLATEVFDPEYKPTRATLAETYNQIISDFNTAIGMLDDNNGTGYMNKLAATALRARAYLYMGQYANALADAKTVIDSGKYSLYTTANYADVWAAEGTSESILELLITSTYSVQRNSLGYYTDCSGYPEAGLNPDGALFTYLVNNPADIRNTMIKDQTTSSDAPGYYPNKYPGRGSLYVNNPKIIRLSEIYLIAAEASFYLEGGAAAAPYINEIEKNRIEGYTDVATVTIDDIIFEYTKELFAENQIAFAYWRNGQPVINQLGQAIPASHQRAVLPIPQREIDMNSALHQNDGY